MRNQSKLLTLLSFLLFTKVLNYVSFFIQNIENNLVILIYLDNDSGFPARAVYNDTRIPIVCSEGNSLHPMPKFSFLIGVVYHQYGSMSFQVSTFPCQHPNGIRSFVIQHHNVHGPVLIVQNGYSTPLITVLIINNGSAAFYRPFKFHTSQLWWRRAFRI